MNLTFIFFLGWTFSKVTANFTHPWTDIFLQPRNTNSKLNVWYRIDSLNRSSTIVEVSSSFVLKGWEEVLVQSSHWPPHSTTTTLINQQITLKSIRYFLKRKLCLGNFSFINTCLTKEHNLVSMQLIPYMYPVNFCSIVILEINIREWLVCCQCLSGCQSVKSCWIH